MTAALFWGYTALCSVLHFVVQTGRATMATEKNEREPDDREWVEPIPDTFDNIVRAVVGAPRSPEPIRESEPPRR